LGPALVQSQYIVDNNTSLFGLFGPRDENLRLIEEGLNVRIVARGNELSISGEADVVEKTRFVLRDLATICRRRQYITPQEVRYAVQLASEGSTKLTTIQSDVVAVTARGKQIFAKTMGQKIYAEAIRRNGIVFGIGPAGTGKTYLAMAMAVTALKNKEVNRLVLTRPAVEAGEKLGFLPGDLQEKVDPYLRPLYDALYDIMGVDVFQRHMERGLIEVAPLAYMRGRTLDDAFIILDEAQNTTPEQMKMFLTRMGFGSKIVVTGDITQVDLPEGQYSGLMEVQSILANVPGIAFVYLDEKDVVRHELVQKIIKAYEAFGVRKPKGQENSEDSHKQMPVTHGTVANELFFTTKNENSET
jgi:phosphate starvation-inducible PhoH-like protein